ncbi:FtsX-like permease family protein [Marinomonas transparens]|uniref:ABC transporter permease n=1 Tax=Marinomonas transparens TaxID=2795388 RepID=A0A934N7S7_9GAMM|nr:ABC transporter permease [Marinomonas transparens]MBJ7539366.1 ABC transporter permease [Marinomonas transparens]
MNPWMLLKAWYRQYTWPCVIFIALFSVALSLGVALLSQERAIKQSSANVSDQFDLIIGAPGSKIDLVLDIAFLQTGFLETVPTHVWHDLLDDERVKWFAPVVLGDGYAGSPIIGTTQPLLASIYGETENFPNIHSAFVGANVELKAGQIFQPQHGMLESSDEDEAEEHTHHVDYQVVRKLPITGTPWDNAILVPVEATWAVHGLGDGHAEDEHEGHEHGVHEGHEHEKHEGHEHEEHKGYGYEEHEEHDHEREGHNEVEHLGTFDEHDPLKPVSAFIVKPITIASAYGLRSDFSNNETQGVFPAEVMVTLYALMGDARALMSQITLICEALVMLSLVFGIAALFALFKREFAILRTIGATRSYLLLSVWMFVFSLMAVGLLVGMVLATLEVQWISYMLSNKVQFNIEATLGGKDWLFALAVLLVGSVLALLPALFVYRVSNEKLMQSI